MVDLVHKGMTYNYWVLWFVITFCVLQFVWLSLVTSFSNQHVLSFLPPSPYVLVACMGLFGPTLRSLEERCGIANRCVWGISGFWREMAWRGEVYDAMEKSGVMIKTNKEVYGGVVGGVWLYN